MLLQALYEVFFPKTSMWLSPNSYEISKNSELNLMQYMKLNEGLFLPEFK